MQREDLDTICICAIRYCQGRMSYMPSLVQDICRQELQKFSDKTLAVMIDDCKFQEKMNIYGDEVIDKPGWMQWKEDLLKERERRKKSVKQS